MRVYIIKNAAGEILSVNHTTQGCAQELYGLDVVSLNGGPADHDALVRAMNDAERVECEDSAGSKLTVERHFVGA